MKKIILHTLLLMPIFITANKLVSNSEEKFPQQAVIIEPFAELLGQQVPSKKNIVHKYRSLPVCGGPVEFYRSCPRLHQALFNEIVEVVAQDGEEVQIKIPNLYFLTGKNNFQHNTYWTLKSNIITFNQLHEKKIDPTKFPSPISFQESQKKSLPNTVGITMPWYDPITRKTYSAGTRFVLAHQQPSKTLYVIHVFDKRSESFVTAKIPQSQCIKDLPKTHQERTALFVELLRKWANQPQHFIPYVWGGCSFITTHKADDFNTVIKKNYSHITRSESEHIPKSGFDCSGLIARAAQLSGIPYYYKNTSTLERMLKPLQTEDKIQEGDLIKIVGHVMIVASLEKNTLIEARGYSDGFGKIHELPLGQVFKNINTYDELMNAYTTKKPLTRLNHNGQESQLFKVFNLLKLESCWQQS